MASSTNTRSRPCAAFIRAPTASPQRRRPPPPPPCRASSRLSSPPAPPRLAGVAPSAERPVLVTVEADGSDRWRLEQVGEWLAAGAVGVVPTDSLPAVVCDADNRASALRLFDACALAPKKQLSVIVSSLSDAALFTTGFPAATVPGRADLFSAARRVLPGPYTFILPAAKRMPAQVVDRRRGTARHRRTVGVRLPGDGVSRAVVEAMAAAKRAMGGLGEGGEALEGAALLAHSVHGAKGGGGGAGGGAAAAAARGGAKPRRRRGNDGDDDDDDEAYDDGAGELEVVPDAGELLEAYSKGPAGPLDFVVVLAGGGGGGGAGGGGGGAVALPSTVVDCTGPVPVVVRRGAGDASLFEDAA
jgi:tRNA A37 threonylcarbamoyladenosine synthetase subunit TsaC/SUA5/YrdC